MNIHADFLALEELQFLTGRKQKNAIKLWLGNMGIDYKENANGFPIVRRDYAQSRSRKTIQSAVEEEWIPNVLRKGG